MLVEVRAIEEELPGEEEDEEYEDVEGSTDPRGEAAGFAQKGGDEAGGTTDRLVFEFVGGGEGALEVERVGCAREWYV